MNKPLSAPYRFVDNLPRGFGFLKSRLAKDGIKFRPMRSQTSIQLFKGGADDIAGHDVNAGCQLDHRLDVNHRWCV